MGNRNKVKQYHIEFIDMSEEQYENGYAFNGNEYEYKEFGEGYTIEDFYSDNSDMRLEDLGDGWYTYAREWVDGLGYVSRPLDDEDAEKRYVYVRKFEQVVDDEDEGAEG